MTARVRDANQASDVGCVDRPIGIRPGSRGSRIPIVPLRAVSFGWMVPGRLDGW